MDMLRQLLGMDSDSQSAEQQEGNGKGQEGSQRGSGNNPGRGANGKSNMASSQDKGVSNPDTAAETRSVPKSTGHVRRRHAFRIPQGAGRLQQDFAEVRRISPDSPFTHEQQLPVSMKNPRLLLTAFLTCCMTAAPQNARPNPP